MSAGISAELHVGRREDDTLARTATTILLSVWTAYNDNREEESNALWSDGDWL